jgi:FAD/FMN-containing dehydrogenase
MNKVEVDREALTAKVGGGALWEHVDKACGHKGTAAVGGTANQTGVSG